jgi:hypothetical protein
LAGILHYKCGGLTSELHWPPHFVEAQRKRYE